MIDTDASKMAMYTTNICKVLLRASSKNSCLSIYSTYLAIGISSTMVYFLYISSFVSNLMSTLLRNNEKFEKSSTY